MYRPDGLIQGDAVACLAGAMEAAPGISVVEDRQPSGALAPRQVSRKNMPCALPSGSSTRFAARDSNTTKRPSALTEGFWLAPSPNEPSSVALIAIVDGLHRSDALGPRHISTRKTCVERFPKGDPARSMVEAK